MILGLKWRINGKHSSHCPTFKIVKKHCEVVSLVWAKFDIQASWSGFWILHSGIRIFDLVSRLFFNDENSNFMNLVWKLQDNELCGFLWRSRQTRSLTVLTYVLPGDQSIKRILRLWVTGMFSHLTSIFRSTREEKSKIVLKADLNKLFCLGSRVAALD